VCSTHRSHYHALLKGIPPEWVKKQILLGHSISLCNSDYKFVTSAIVGGILPIAVGIAMTGQTVWVFVGDMASESGTFHECVKYATGQNLPIHFIVEDNGMSVNTPTDKVWRYSYQRIYPHAGSGKYVIF
jgi:TPP-dependent pyruvate/acetoin dehydrogenase alpha subunit